MTHAEAIEAVETLIEHFVEAHEEEVRSDHFGDDRCSYCRAIADARRALDLLREGKKTS